MATHSYLHGLQAYYAHGSSLHACRVVENLPPGWLTSCFLTAQPTRTTCPCSLLFCYTSQLECDLEWCSCQVGTLHGLQAYTTWIKPSSQIFISRACRLAWHVSLSGIRTNSRDRRTASQHSHGWKLYSKLKIIYFDCLLDVSHTLSYLNQLKLYTTNLSATNWA